MLHWDFHISPANLPLPLCFFPAQNPILVHESASCTHVMSYTLEDLPKPAPYRLETDGKAWTHSRRRLLRARKQNRSLSFLNLCLKEQQEWHVKGSSEAGKSQVRLYPWLKVRKVAVNAGQGWTARGSSGMPRTDVHSWIQLCHWTQTLDMLPPPDIPPHPPAAPAPAAQSNIAHWGELSIDSVVQSIISSQGQ